MARKRAAFGFLLAGVLAGCGVSNPNGLNRVQALKQYQQAQAALPLPSGSSWPAVAFGSSDNDSFGDGAGQTQAEAVWKCDWQGIYLAAQTGSAQRANALTELDKMKQTFTYRSALQDDGRAIVDAELSKASLGDPSGIKNDYTANCPEGDK